jgi:UDP:flavonoid glycosyltransferase YjiC (YdhE family)
MPAARILCTFAGGAGHADPLVPVAAAMRDAGHEVAFHGRRSGAGTAMERGFPVFVDPEEAPGDPRTIAPLEPVDRGREERLLTGFTDRIARARATKIIRLAAAWQSDLIVCDEADFGGMLAAERIGVPHAVVLINASGSFGRTEVVAPALRRVRRDLSLDPDGVESMLRGRLTLNPFPPSFRDPRFPLPEPSASFRPEPIVASDAAVPASIEGLSGDRPTIYVTLGTIFPAESGDLFPRLLTAIGGLEVNAVVTVGRELDPARFGPQPDRIVVERFVPQDLILPRCDLVVNHAGSGSILGAIAHGLPIVALPLGADQPWNADRIEALRLGVVLDAITATPDDLAAAIGAALSDAAMRDQAAAMRGELERLPDVKATVRILERLADASGSGAP